MSDGKVPVVIEVIRSWDGKTQEGAMRVPVRRLSRRARRRLEEAQAWLLRP